MQEIIIRSFNKIILKTKEHGVFIVENLTTGFQLQTRDLPEAKRAWISQVMGKETNCFSIDYNIMHLEDFKTKVASYNSVRLIGWSLDQKTVILNNSFECWEADLKEQIAFTCFPGDRLDNAIALFDEKILDNVSFKVSPAHYPKWYINNFTKEQIEARAFLADKVILPNLKTIN